MTILDAIRVLAFTMLSLHLIAPKVCEAAEDSPKAAVYDSKVKFEKGQPLRFSDFELTYTGKRHVKPPQFPRGWWIHDFTVRSKGATQTVSWSAGTGDIGPTRFTVNGATFQIELSRSDKLGPLREDEVVVSSVK